MSLKPPPPLSLNDDTLDLTVRFSASLPDLLLSIDLHSQPNGNTSTLKRLIRTHLPSEYSNRRIRLIHAGKALLDDAPLATLLKRTVSRPPSRPPTPALYSQDEQSPSAKLKGKAPIRDTAAQARIYIHCSIGDVVLSPAELAAETTLANSAQSIHSPSHDAISASAAEVEAPPAPAPRGFDRLLTAGFTPAEVSNLRLQFLSIQSHTHTPDTMPSPHTLRNMEDQWLDNSNPSSNLTSNEAGDGGMGGFTADDEVGALDDMIYGVSMGFFWPVGCLVWGVREEGVWSRRRKMAVVIGVFLNFGLGMVRYGG